MNEPPRSLALLRIPSRFHWDSGRYEGDARSLKKKRKKRKLKRVVLNASEYSRLNNEDKAKYDFSWLGGEERRVIMNALFGHTTKGIFHHELTVHAPDLDRMSRDSQHRVWNGYAWEIV
jgi:hypothetical protein